MAKRKSPSNGLIGDDVVHFKSPGFIPDNVGERANSVPWIEISRFVWNFFYFFFYFDI
jgi:hypothetical protein